MAALRGLRSHPTWRFLADDASFGEPTVDPGPFVGHRQAVDFHLVDLAAGHGLILTTFDAGLPGALAPVDRRHVRVLTP